jgi:hypothetical protein
MLPRDPHINTYKILIMFVKPLWYDLYKTKPGCSHIERALLLAQASWRRMSWILENELEGKRTESVVAWFEALSHYLSRGTEENKKSLSPGRDSNQSSPEHKSVSSEATCSVHPLILVHQTAVSRDPLPLNDSWIARFIGRGLFAVVWSVGWLQATDLEPNEVLAKGTWCDVTTINILCNVQFSFWQPG